MAHRRSSGSTQTPPVELYRLNNGARPSSLNPSARQSPAPSRAPSRPVSVYSRTSRRESSRLDGLPARSQEENMEFRAQMMINWLYTEQMRNGWIGGTIGEGVVLRQAKGEYVCLPDRMPFDGTGLFEVLRMMNVSVSIFFHD